MKDNCLIVAGEASGEEHCLSFLEDIRSICPNIAFWGVGGDRMKSQGVELVYHLRDFSTWGYSGVLRKLPFYLKALSSLVGLVKAKKTRVAILIDFQEFNLKLAEKLSKEGVNILYYVAPQVWAWKSWRIQTLKKAVHTLFTILPFEKKWFASCKDLQILSAPHPLWIKYKDRLPDLSNPVLPQDVALLLLPGSRGFEVEKLLPEFIRTVRMLREVLKKESRNVFVRLVRADSVPAKIYDPFKKEIHRWYKSCELEEALNEAHCALAASGTVTLATALFGIPTVVAYKVTLLNEFIFHTFLDYQGSVCLANIVHGRNVFPEFLQNRATAFNMTTALLSWLQDERVYRQRVRRLSITQELLKGEVQDSGLYMGKMIREIHEI